jgi:hypothetical protein
VVDGPFSKSRAELGRTPRFPFQDWPIQLSTAIGFVWYTSPGVFVSQLTIPHATLEHARTLTSSVAAVVEAKRSDFAEFGGLLVLHDWKSLKSYDAAARSHVFSELRARRKGDVRGVIVSLTLTPLLRMAIEAGNALLTATTGRSVEIVPSISAVLGKYRVEKPSDERALARVALDSRRPPPNT